MPARSPRQQRYMAMCANNPGAANGKCPPKKVAQEFSHKPGGGYSPAQMAKAMKAAKPS